MKKWVCGICGYVAYGETPPEACPQCKAPASKFVEQSGEAAYADEHRIGVAADVEADVKEGLMANFTGECTEVGMYLAMSRQADREGYPEIAEAFKRYAFEEAEHAAKFAELLGEVVTSSTKKLGYDAIHDTVHEMAKDEARHGCGFAGLLKRYFGE